MLIKTEEFVRMFERDLYQIQISKHSPIYLKGSYKIKPVGSVITDIDVGEKISASPNVLKRLVQIINTSKKFIFVKMYCGDYNEFIPPWTIGSEGGCSYNPGDARKWFNKISKLDVSTETLEAIKFNLFGEYICLKNLLEIQRLLMPYSNIIWRIDDIEAGVKTMSGHVYNLVEMIREGANTVIEYIYRYTSVRAGVARDDFCSIDFGIDPVHYRIPEKLYDYYKNSWYTIFKSYKWYLKDEYKGEYVDVIKLLEHMTGLINRIKLLRKVVSLDLLTPKDREFILQDCTKQAKLQGIKFTYENLGIVMEKLSKKIDKISREYIPVFRKKIQERFEPMITSYEMKAKIGEIPVSQEMLRKNLEDGFKCPFFTALNDDFSYVYGLSKRTGLDPVMMIECVRKVAKAFSLPITVVIGGVFPKNNWRVEKDGELFIVKEGKIVVKSFSNIEKAQKYVLTGGESSKHSGKVMSKSVINGLTLTGNSCYADSLFICLLAVPNTFVDKNILNKRLKEGVYENFSCNSDPKKDLDIRQEIQDELRKLTENIRGQSQHNKITCTNFRKIIRGCKTTNKYIRFHGTGQQDPVEFLEYICNIFGIRFTATFNEDPIGYLAISYPDFRAFIFDRRMHKNTEWPVPKTTKVGSNVLQLSSVITYTPGHYTCFFRLGAVWYFYNDMSNPLIKTIGSYNDLLQNTVGGYKINVQTHGVLYFYNL
jgi:hypothetical protein